MSMLAAAPDYLPIVLVPGLNCSARLYAQQFPALWRFGPVTVADHTRDDSIAVIARRTLAAAPPRFGLAGLSMGGYLAFEIIRPQRVAKLLLLVPERNGQKWWFQESAGRFVLLLRASGSLRRRGTQRFGAPDGR
jgi:pimeloyl-ACP methyl ester carboxylesterase